MHLLIALTLVGSVGSVEYSVVGAERDAYAECKEDADEAAESDTEGDDDGCTGGACQCRGDAGGPGLSLLYGLVLAGVRLGRRARRRPNTAVDAP